MRALALSVLSAAALTACVSSYDNPYYQHASNAPTQTATAPAPSQPVFVNYDAATQTQSQIAQSQTVSMPEPVIVLEEDILAGAPTDTHYADRSVSGTPGYMAVQGEAPDGTPVSVEMATIESVTAGTPIEYDLSQNFVQADAVTAPQMSETIRISPSAGQSYVVQPGDTVYSLSRRTCVGVSVIQSMNGLDTTYGIKIGQSLRLPASKC